MKKIFIVILIGAIASCNKRIDQLRPLTLIDAEGQLAALSGILENTVGSYTMLSGVGFTRYDVPVINLGEGRGGNVTLQEFRDVNKESDGYFFRNSNGPTLGYSADFYRGSYQIIVGVNTTLEGIVKFENNSLASMSEDDKNSLSYAKGENIFLRAFTYFNLVRIYGKPYYQNAAASTAVPLKFTSDTKEQPAPATVKEVYDFVISELKTAANLMNVPVQKKNRYASRQAAWALLSRVYLYMGGTTVAPDAGFNQLAVTYADSVIDFSGGKYALLQGNDYNKMFADDETGSLGRPSITGNKEIIWAQDHSQARSNIGEQFHFDRNYNVGAVFLPSSEFKGLLVTGDMRKTFFKVNQFTGFEETTKYLSLNEAWLTAAPMIYFRLAEIYLNRAEAYAKLNNFSMAKADLKQVHARAGLPASDIDNLSDAAVLTAVLKERRMELAFEGHAGYDNFRNGLPLVRPAADNNGNELVIQPDNPKVVFTIPNL